MQSPDECTACAALRERIAKLEALIESGKALDALRQRAVDATFAERTRWEITANEWRGTITDLIARCVSRAEFDAHKELQDNAAREARRLIYASLGIVLTSLAVGVAFWHR